MLYFSIMESVNFKAPKMTLNYERGHFGFQDINQFIWELL